MIFAPIYNASFRASFEVVVEFLGNEFAKAAGSS
jgi:hypothetical protein